MRRFALVLLLVACGQKEEVRPAVRPAAVEGAMCEEHGVLAALCTKHNPKLIPVFQAKGDWCAEHGFPESICPICHPERGGKPAAAITAEAAPADGTRIRLRGKETAAHAGVKTAKAGNRRGWLRFGAAGMADGSVPDFHASADA